MAGPRVSQSSGHSCWKQWWRRSPNACCSKKILLLLMWQALFSFSFFALEATAPLFNVTIFYTSVFLSYSSAPIIGWLADVKFGRYKVIVFGSIASFLASILFYIAMVTIEDDSTLSNVLSYIAFVIVRFGATCYSAAMLPFLTDQIIGATSDELSAVVRWYYWAEYLGIGLSQIVIFSGNINFGVGSILIFAIPLAMIIISECLCQQWLDRTHKATNPIKLIIKVLNYTRKHSYPERRSAFTYIDEEQPSRMDYGKDKFGGPFTEEEVEDVKTVLRLLPLVVCLSLAAPFLDVGTNSIYLFDYRDESLFILNTAINITWLFALLLIPLYQLLLYRCFHNCSPSMLRCISAALFMCILGYILLSALEVVGVIVSDGVQRYLSCTPLADRATYLGNLMEWYWKLDPYVLYGIGYTAIGVLVFELIIAQSPEKMKGFVLGISVACNGFAYLLTSVNFLQFTFTLCFDLTISLILVVLFVVFLILSKCYTLRERNREINMQAIVEEHHERYLDQEEQYMRENPQYFESLESESFSDDDSNSD